jgi:regulator of protease activity HflC (stomatin/prohibitin superfamily)
LKANSSPPNRGEPGVIILIVVALVVTAVGLTLEDAVGESYGSIMGIVWFAAFIVSFLFGLLFYARYILPLSGGEGWSEGLRLLYRHYTTQAERYLDNLFGPRPATGYTDAGRTNAGRKSRRSRQEAKSSGLLPLPASFATLKAGILHSYQILGLAKGNQFARPAGPGFTLLFKKEKPTQLIDLRKQLRRQPVKATTRDGISLETTVTVIFRVRQEAVDVSGSEPYPYDKEAIFHICYSSSIDAQDRLRSWTEQVAPRAAALLVNELGRRTLDDLYTPETAGAGPLDAIKARILQTLQRELDASGIEVLVVGVDSLALPPVVIEQRIKTWQADWQRRITLQQAAGDAEAVRRIKKARARAQIEIIENITQNIDSVRRAGDADLSNIITLRMIEALEEALSSASLQALIPQHIMTNLVMDSSTQMQAWLNQPREPEQ